MSPAERFARNHKLRTDQVIRQAYSRLAADPVACATFVELLCCARRRAPSLFSAPCNGASHPGIDALVNLSRWSLAYVRAIANWPGSPGGWRMAIDSFARHLLAKYPIPRFLTSAWYLPEGRGNERQQRWFVMHGNGSSFRSLDLPISMTRRMEDIFLRSPDHMDILVAMRRAELKGLQISEGLAAAILSTRLAGDLGEGDFWRTVWHFLRANAGAIDRRQVGPIIDFVYGIRQERIVVLTPDGASRIEPSQPHFSMKGRTVASLLRLMEEWRCDVKSGDGLSWSRSALPQMAVALPSAAAEVRREWRFIELTSRTQLKAEGSALRHCVATYAKRCWRGTCQIWALRFIRGAKARSVVTLEIDPTKRAIVQVRGFRNRQPSPEELQIIGLWADHEGLRLAI